MKKEFSPHLAYLASAGSGKTFALTRRYISLLFLDVEPSTILTATFTNKAALEMKHRIINSLINLADNNLFLDEVSKETGLSREEILKKQPEILDRFLSSPKFIVTLDSFFVSILRSASLYIGLEPDFLTKEIDIKYKESIFLEEIKNNSLLNSLVRVVIDIEDRRFLKLFELMQNFYKIEPLLPKNRYKIENLSELEDKIESKRELLLDLVVESGASKRAINNFKKIDIKEFFKKSLFSKSSLLEHRDYRKYAEKNPQIEDEFLELKELLREWADKRESIVLYNLFKIFDYYKNANILTAKSLGVLSFDDLSYFTHRLLSGIDRDFLYFKMDSHFKHILLDEFQDTSIIQFLLLKPIIDEIFSGNSEFRTLFYVGDTKQSLYRFRGGVEELFNLVSQQYSIPIKQMDINYRSSKVVVEQVNRWFERSMEEYFPQKYRDDAKEGFVEVSQSDNLIEEVLKKVEFFLDNGVDLSDIAILVSTNRDGATIQEALYKSGYDSRLKTSSSLKYIPKIASIVAMVEYLYDNNRLDAMALLEQIGKDLEDINLDWFNPYMQPIEVIHRVISDFGYFDSDLNILKLLEFASSYSNIQIFIEEFKLSNIEVASSSKHGIMIMTIHGSKGLEFPHLIVLDRLKGNAPDNSALIYDYDESLNIKRVYYKMSKRENFDEHYRTLIEKQKILSKKDKLNILYVALTRAVESMIIIRKPKGSIFDDIGLTPIKVGKLDIVKKSKPKREKIKIDIRLENYGTQELTNRDEKIEDKKAINFGIAMHYTLEMLRDFTSSSLKDAIEATKNRYGLDLTNDEFIDIENRVDSLISNSSFKKILDGAVDITKEQSISFNGKVKQIDLLIEYSDRYLVIDYKSSKKSNLQHKSQVRGYIKAIKSITKKQTDGVIIYLLKDKIEIDKIN